MAHATRQLAAAPRGTFSQECKPFPNKRVVLVTVNEDYVDMYRNWLRSARPFLQSTEQLVVVAEDANASNLIEAISDDETPPFSLVKPGSKAVSLLQAPWDSKVYGAVVTKRPARIRELVLEGCSVLYVDIDTVWTKDPFLAITAAGEGNLYLTEDGHEGLFHGNYPILGNFFDGTNFCTCFMYFHPAAATVKLLNDWETHMYGHRNQPPFNEAVQAMDRDSGLKIVTLSNSQFPPGWLAAGKPDATVFHANWMKGQQNKVRFFEERGMWEGPPSASFARAGSCSLPWLLSVFC